MPLQLLFGNIGVEVTVIQHFQSEADHVDPDDAGGHGRSHGGRDRKKRQLHAEHPPAPKAAEETDVDHDEAVIDQGPAQRSPLRHVKPAEVPNQAHRSSIEPLPAGAVHEVGLAAPHEEEQNEPGAQEVGEDEAGQNRGEEGEGHQAGQQQAEVPRVVDQWRDHDLLLLVGQEGAEWAVVHGHAEGDGRGRAEGLQHWRGGEETGKSFHSTTFIFLFLLFCHWQGFHFKHLMSIHIFTKANAPQSFDSSLVDLGSKIPSSWIKR